MTKRYKMIRSVKEIKDHDGETVGFAFRGFNAAGCNAYEYCDLYVPAKAVHVTKRADEGYTISIHILEIMEVKNYEN